MKIAKVVDVRDVSAPKIDNSSAAVSSARVRAEELLRLYPKTTETQTEEIREFLTTGTHYDVGMVAGNDEFREKVAAFRKAHNKDFRVRPLELLIPFLLLATLAALAWYFTS